MLEIRSKLAAFEKLTWKEILVNQGHRHHSVPTVGICKEAQDCLEETGYGGLEEIVSLRLAGAERVWGVMESGVLVLLWWDPHHEVWPTSPN